jgi:hypothetical protein
VAHPSITFHERYNAPEASDSAIATLAGRVAIKLAEHFGIVAAMPDGEDSAGRMKLRLLTPDEVVDRSIAISERLCEQINARGWLIDVPPPKANKEGDE